MTTEQAKQMYWHIFPHEWFSDAEWEEIRIEMDGVADAETDENAADVIRWWELPEWQENPKALMREVRKLRRYAKKHNL